MEHASRAAGSSLVRRVGLLREAAGRRGGLLCDESILPDCCVSKIAEPITKAECDCFLYPRGVVPASSAVGGVPGCHSSSEVIPTPKSSSTKPTRALVMRRATANTLQEKINARLTMLPESQRLIATDPASFPGTGTGLKNRAGSFRTKKPKTTSTSAKAAMQTSIAGWTLLVAGMGTTIAI